METVIDEIERAIEILLLGPEDIRKLAPVESEAIFNETLRQFVSGGDRKWWWEAFSRPSTSAEFPTGDGWRRLAQIVPDPDELVWFIVEDDQLSHYPVFEVTPRAASRIIGECYGFEYYLVAKDYSWLVCETHHNRVFAVGRVVGPKLAAATA